MIITTNIIHIKAQAEAGSKIGDNCIIGPKCVVHNIELPPNTALYGPNKKRKYEPDVKVKIIIDYF